MGLFSFTKEEATKYQDINYIRVLGFNKNGRQYLNSIKKEVDVPILTNYSNDDNNYLRFEMRVAKVLSILKGIDFINQEYQNQSTLDKHFIPLIFFFNFIVVTSIDISVTFF